MKILNALRRALLMPLTVFLLLTVTIASVAQAADSQAFDWSNVDSQPEQAAYISRRLHAWREPHADAGKPLRFVYFHPKDRQPLTDHAERWDGIMSDFQQFFRDQMTRLGYPDAALHLEREGERLKIHHVTGAGNDDSYSYRSGARIRDEVFQALDRLGIDASQETVLIVCGLSKTEDQQVRIYSPFYGMGADHTHGVCFAADAEHLAIHGLRPTTEKITLQVKEHRDYEPFTLQRFNTTYIGGVIHELGHGLSLPHCHATKEQDKLGTALMGAGNYTYRQEWRNEGLGSFLTHAHGLRLLVHPVFSGTSHQCTESPGLRLSELNVSVVENELHVRGRLQAEIPAIAMIAYNDGEDAKQPRYHVNNDYDATTWTSVVSPQQEFWIRVGDLKDGNHQLRLVSVHANGATVVHRLHYTTKNGTPDLARMKDEITKMMAAQSSQKP